MKCMLRLLGSCVGAALITCTVALNSWGLPLSPGDRVKISIPEGEDFSGLFEINGEGNLDIPYLAPLPVAGLEAEEAERRLRDALITGRFFQPSFLRVSLKVSQWAQVPVFVSGATYAPGRVLINDLTDAEKTQSPVALTGQYAPKRTIVNAIREAGGLKPTADISAIQLTRNGQTQSVNLAGVLSGEPFEDISLIAGDQIFVPDSGQFNNQLVRPTAITPIGVKVFLSNLTVPASSNATSAIGKDATSFPYGARFSHAVVAANCAGGTKTTNAGRRAVLVTTDRLTGQTKYLERRVDDILKKSKGDADNPYLMNEDAVACYDSHTTQLRDIAGVISNFLSPLSLLKALFQ
jgi:polysaccharide biosynthesis/export protein